MDNSTKSTAAILSLLALLFIILWGLGDTLVPLIFSFTLAYLFFPVVKNLEKKGVNRNTSVAVLLTFVLLLSLGILATFLPSLINESESFIKELPENSTQALEKVENVFESFGYKVDLSKDSIKSYLKEHTTEISKGVLKSVAKAMKSSFSGIAKILVSILNLFLIPLFFFYITNDFEKISKKMKAFIPKSIQPKMNHYLSLSNEVLSGYIRGQLLVAIILSLLYATGLYAVGLKFGILIGLLSGLICIIPYAGFFLGFGTAILIALANYTDINQIIGIIAIYSIIQGIEGTLITPNLVGNKVGLSALTTMLALIVGGNLFGLIGMLIAIPVAAILKSIMKELFKEYQNSSFYKANVS